MHLSVFLILVLPLSKRQLKILIKLITKLLEHLL